MMIMTRSRRQDLLQLLSLDCHLIVDFFVICKVKNREEASLQAAATLPIEWWGHLW